MSNFPIISMEGVEVHHVWAKEAKQYLAVGHSATQIVSVPEQRRNYRMGGIASC